MYKKTSPGSEIPGNWQRLLIPLLLIISTACSRSMQAISFPFDLFVFEDETAEEQSIPTQEVLPTATEEAAMRPVKITVVYNNIALNTDLETDWGFAAYVEVGDEVVMFDTGTQGDILLRNMEKLGLDPTSVDYLVFSHLHNDHIGGSAALLGTGAQPATYVLSNFPAGFQERLAAITEMTVVDTSMEITEGVYTSGPVPGDITEQALVLETSKGLVVVTGCAHPGANNMVAQSMEAVEGEVYLVLGGFHLGGASETAVQGIITDFRDMGVQNAAPSHCTGEAAMNQFQEAYGENYLSSGLGAVFEIP